MACCSWPGRERERAGLLGKAHANTHVDSGMHIKEGRKECLLYTQIWMSSFFASSLLAFVCSSCTRGEA